jgi:hypothetical protein
MSHHLSASPTNPTGAVEVVRVDSAAATTAPPDTGSGAAPVTGTAIGPAGTGSAGAPVLTDVAGPSGTPGANLPVDSIQQASTTIEGGKADLALTAGAERRLDGFDGVGGGGGEGGDKAGKDGGNGGLVNENNEIGAVAQGTADLNVSDQQGGLAAQLVTGEQVLDPTGGLPDQDPRSLADPATSV